MRIKAALVLAAGIVLGSAILGFAFYTARATYETISVVGSASTAFTADTVKWSLSIARTVPGSELSSGYRQIRDDQELMRSHFLQMGLDDEEITVQPVTSYPMHGPQGEINSYRMTQPMQVISEKLDEVEELALEPGSFLSGEMLLERSQLEYFYSAIDTLKHELLGEATADARRRAEEIAEPTGVTVGPIRQARAGVFQIREPFSTEVSGYGMYNTSSREKEISVTVHATFLVR